MRNLLRVELTRLLWRRAIVLLLAAMIAIPAVIGVVTIIGKEAPGGDAYAEAERAAAKEAERPYVQKDLRRCLENPEDYGILGDLDVEATCKEYVLPQPEWFLSYSQLDLEEERDNGSGFGVAVVVALLAMLFGTTFVGHDWNTGSMGNQLLFETRRLRVWSAKAIAVTVVGLVAAAIGTTAFWLVLASGYWTADVAIPDGVLMDGLQQGWRAAAVAAVAGLGGYALTMLSRSTVFTLGLLFGVSVAGGLVIGLLVEDPGWVDPTVNVTAVINDGATYYVDTPPECDVFFESGPGPEERGVDCSGEKVRSLGQGVTYLVILLGGVSIGSAGSFRRRDVP